MDLKKIAFIISVNDELYFDECCWYINRLHIPDTYEIDIISVREANSMAEAYNAAMESTDTKYKVYLHQDVFIYNRNFIVDMLKVFQADESIGMMGMIGGISLPGNGVTYSWWNCGKLISGDWTKTDCYLAYQKEPYLEVEALDGLLIATQYDIRWREDILKQWDFYDVSQCFEFRKAGYQIVIPFQDAAWINHDCGYNKLRNYNRNRKIMIEAYPEFFTEDFREKDFLYSCELEEETDRFYNEIKREIDLGLYQEAEILLDIFKDNHMNKNLLLLKNILEISKMEKEALITPQILGCGFTTDELIARYTRIKFYLRRLEIGEKLEKEEIFHWIKSNIISHFEIIINTKCNIIDQKTVLEQIAGAYRAGKEEKKAQIIEQYL